MDNTLWALVAETLRSSGAIEQVVFYLLFAMSLASWTLMLTKFRLLRTATLNGRKFIDLFQRADSFGAVQAAEGALGDSPQRVVFKAGLAFLEAARQRAKSGAPPGAPAASADPRQISPQPGAAGEQLLRFALQRAMAAEFSRLQWGIGYLGTAGSTSPFIGLFGTVWGIMTTFRALGTAQSASLAVVAPGIASALIATAAGLAVAIPAVVAYNMLVSRFGALEEDTATFSEELVAVIGQGLGTRAGPPAL